MELFLFGYNLLLPANSLRMSSIVMNTNNQSCEMM